MIHLNRLRLYDRTKKFTQGVLFNLLHPKEIHGHESGQTEK